MDPPKTRLLRALKAATLEVVASVLYYSGLLSLIGNLRRRLGSARLIVPMYHRVRPSDQPSADRILDVQRGISRKLFEQHVQVLHQFGELVTISDGIDFLGEATSRGTRIAITFDDGYRDNLTEAIPVLSQHDGRATIFPVVRTASGGMPLWWDDMTELLRLGNAPDSGLAAIVSGIPELTEVNPPGAGSTIDDQAEFLLNRLVDLPRTRRNEILDAIAERLGVSADQRMATDLYANWDELQEIETECVELGGHTVDHPVLTCEPAQAAEFQVSECREVLSERLGTEVASFSYPNGGHDRTTAQIVAQSGFKTAVTVEHGVNYRFTDRLRLRRMPIGEEPPHHLALKLAFYGLVHRG